MARGPGAGTVIEPSALTEEPRVVAGAAPVAVIVNGSAGADDKSALVDRLVALFQALGVRARVVRVQAGGDLVETVRRAARERPRALVAGGGDGTVNGVASVALEEGLPLGVLPLGTLNHFAKDAGIPLELEQAVRTIAEGHETRVDVGEINGRVFVNNSSIGVYPSIVRRRDHAQREYNLGKWAAFAWAALKVLRRHIFLTVNVIVDGVRHRRRTPFVFVGNNEYQMESLRMGGRSCLNAGKLSIVVARHAGRTGLVRLALRALFGRIRATGEFDAYCATEVRIETHHAQLDVSTDGEVTRMATPLEYRVRPGALRVLVPKT
jgi:YegS/Rv2252/BmrU family lipid kinase